MKRFMYVFGIVIMACMLVLTGCGDDDDDDDTTDGPNYSITADFDMPQTKDGDSLYVIVERLNTDAPSPDEAEIVIGGVTFGLVEYFPMSNEATYGTDLLSLAHGESYAFEVVMGDDTISGSVDAPEPITVTITSPYRAPGDTMFPTFGEGVDIPVTWEYDGGTPDFVEFYFYAVHVPVFMEYTMDFPGTVTSHTIPGDSTTQVGGTTWPMPTIAVLAKDSVIVATDDMEMYFSISNIPGIAFIYIMDTDTTGAYPTPVITITPSTEGASFDWDLDIGAMSLAVYRNTENHGQDHTGMIWTFAAYDPLEGFMGPVTYGTIPEDCWGGDPEEAIISGESYSVMINFLYEEGIGETVIQSWDQP